MLVIFSENGEAIKKFNTEEEAKEYIKKLELEDMENEDFIKNSYGIKNLKTGEYEDYTAISECEAREYERKQDEKIRKEMGFEDEIDYQQEKEEEEEYDIRDDEAFLH